VTIKSQRVYPLSFHFPSMSSSRMIVPLLSEKFLNDSVCPGWEGGGGNAC
jgi:hypothetical protein